MMQFRPRRYHDFAGLIIILLHQVHYQAIDDDDAWDIVEYLEAKLERFGRRYVGISWEVKEHVSDLMGIPIEIY